MQPGDNSLCSVPRRALVGLTLVLAIAGSAWAETPLFGPPPLPEPPTTAAPAAPADDAGTADTKSKVDKTSSKDDGKKKDADKPLGEEPPDDALEFFRQSNVLLEKGTLQVDWGFQYALVDDDFVAILPSTDLVPQTTSARSYLATLSLQYGLTDRFQPFVTLPMGMTHVEQANLAAQDTAEVFGIGDASVGGSYLWRDGKGECADIVVTGELLAPTGDSDVLALTPPVAALGGGFWGVGGNVNWTRTYDPVVVFASTGYTHRFEREFSGVAVRPGGQLTAAGGFGFAINDEITYSMQCQIAHLFDTAVAGIDVDDSGIDVASLRHAIILRVAPQRFVEVFVADGMTNAAPDVNVGAIFTRRY